MSDGPVLPEAMTDSPEDDGAEAAAVPMDAGSTEKRLPPAVRGVIGVAVLVAGGLAALPWAVSQTSIGDRVAAAVASKLPPGTTVGRPSLSWLRPAGVLNVGYSEPGLSVAVDRVSVDRPFWNYITKPAIPKRIAASGVQVRIDLDTYGSGPTDPESDQSANKGEDKQSLPELPDLTVEDAVVELQGGGLAAPVTLRIPAATISAIGDHYDFASRIEVWSGLATELVTETSTAAGTIDVAGTLATDRSLAVDLKSTALDCKSLQAAVGFALPTGPTAFELDLQQTDNLITGRFGMTAPRLTCEVAESGDPVTLQTVKSIVRFTADTESKFVNLEQIRLQSDQLSASAVGQWDWLADADPLRDRELDANVNVAGPLLHTLGLPTDFVLPQAQLKDVVIREADSELLATGQLTWPSLTAYGLNSRDGRVAWTATADRGTVMMTHAPVGTGFVRGRYDIDWSAEPRLQFAGGPMLERIVLTERLCRDWIRYVSPALANGTEVDGQFSLAMAPFTMPLDGRPESFEGALQIERASLRPGPLLSNLAGRVRAVRLATGRDGDRRLPQELIQVPPQTVRFVGDARGVRHNRFELRMKNVGIATEAAVGYDQSLAGRLTIQPPPNVGTDRTVLQGLAAGPLTFAIGGTVSKPQLQRGAVRDVGRQLLQNGGQQLIQRLLDR